MSKDIVLKFFSRQYRSIYYIIAWYCTFSVFFSYLRKSFQTVIINGAKNEAANGSIINALKTLKGKSSGNVGNVWTVQINDSDASESIDAICNTWSKAISKGGSSVPDVILDMTIADVGAEVTASFTASMGVPTLSAEYGQEDDIKYWRDLDFDQRGYLVQVSCTIIMKE